MNKNNDLSKKLQSRLFKPMRISSSSMEALINSKFEEIKPYKIPTLESINNLQNLNHIFNEGYDDE